MSMFRREKKPRTRSFKESLATWAELHERQADAAARRIAEDGRSEEWLAAVNRRIDESEAAVQSRAESGRHDDEAHLRWEDVPIVAEVTQASVAMLVREATNTTNPEARATAREALHQCVRLAAVGDHPPVPETGVNHALAFVDRFVAWAASHLLATTNELHPVSSANRRGASRLRWVLTVLAFVCTTSAAFAVGLGYYLASLTLLMFGVGFDVLEGSVGRLTHTDSPVGRWVACLASHLGDLVFIIGLSWDQQQLGHPVESTLLLAAGSLALYGSLVRTSARQVGRIFWRSLAERLARFVAFVAYLTLALAGLSNPSIVPLLTVAGFGGFGLWETVRVGLSVRHHPIDSITTVIEESNGRYQSFVEEADHKPVETGLC